MDIHTKEGLTVPSGLKDEPETEIELLQKLIARGDVATIHEMVSFWKAVKTLWIFSGLVRRAAIGAASVLVALAVLNESVRDGVKKWLGF